MESEGLQRIWKWRKGQRYYVMRIQNDLFGEWTLCKEWGSLRSRAGRLVPQTYSQYEVVL